MAQVIPIEEIRKMVRDEVINVADDLLQQEVEKQVGLKLSGRGIDTMKQIRVHKKTLDAARKMLNELDLIDRIVNEQSERRDQPDDPEMIESTRRISDDISLKLQAEIEVIVERSMEKAIADEFLQEVQVAKLTKTPTVEPKLGKFGVRHGQVFMVLLFLAISFAQRADITVAIVAIENNTNANPNYRQYRWNGSEKGLLLSSFYWGYFFAQIPAGLWAEKHGPKMVMGISMTLASTLALLMPAATLATRNWLGLYLLKVLQGICQGAFIPSVYVFVAKWIPPNEKSKLFTPAFGGMQLGTVVAVPIFGFLCASYLGWPFTFFLSAISGYTWVVMWIFMAANSPSVHRSISREEKLYIEGSFGFGEITIKGAKKTIPWKDMLMSIPFIAVVIGHFGENWNYFFLLTMMPTYLSTFPNVDIKLNTLLSATIYFVGWAFVLILGFTATNIREKVGYSRTLERKVWTSFALYGLGSVFILTGFLQPTSIIVVILLLTTAVSLNSFIYNGLFSNHADLSPNYAGILIGLSNTIANTASLMIPIYVGITSPEESEPRLNGWSVIFFTCGGIAFVTNTVYLFLGSAEIQPWNTPRNLHEHLTKSIGPFNALDSFRRRFKVSNTKADTNNEYKHRNSV